MVRALALQAPGPASEALAPKLKILGSLTPGLRGREKQILRALWPASLDEKGSFEFSERLWSSEWTPSEAHSEQHYEEVWLC